MPSLKRQKIRLQILELQKKSLFGLSSSPFSHTKQNVMPVLKIMKIKHGPRKSKKNT